MQNYPKLITFIIRFFLIFIFLYIVFLIVQLVIGIHDILLFMFPHRTLSAENFYKKYGIALVELTWTEELRIFCFEFYDFWYTEFNWTKFNILGFIVVIGLLYYIFNLKATDRFLKKWFIIFDSKEIKITRNLCLKENLLDYHKIVYSFFAIYNLEKILTKEQWSKNKKKRLINIYNLYHIIINHSSKELLVIVLNYKKYLEFSLKKPNENFLQFVYVVELKHCNLLIDILEEKKKNEEKMPLDFTVFVEKMATNFNSQA